MSRTLDLRDRCARCDKLISQRKGPMGEMARRNYEEYKPYCSYHCQEWANLEEVQAYLRTLPGDSQ